MIGLTGGGGGVVLPVGGPPTPVDPGWLLSLSSERRDALVGLLVGTLAGTIHDVETSRALRGIERQLLQRALRAIDGST